MRKFFKYCGFGLILLLVLWLISVGLIYFFLGGERIKNYAIKTVKENTQGELNLGSLKLHLFPLVHFNIKDLSFKSSSTFDRKEILACKSAELSFDIFTLIMGKPLINLHVERPVLNIVSDGKTTNINDVFEKEDEKKERKRGSGNIFESFLTKEFTLDIDDASFKYTAPKGSVDVEGLDLNMDIDPLVGKMSLELNLPVDYKKMEATINGDLKVFAEVVFESENKSNIKANVDATRLLIRTNAIDKKKGDILNVGMIVETDLRTKVTLKNMTISLLDDFFSVNGRVSNYMNLSPEFYLNVVFPENFHVSSLGSTITFLKGHNLSGTLQGNMSLKESMSTKLLPEINADLKYVAENKKNSIALKVNNSGKNKRLIYVNVYSPKITINPRVSQEKQMATAEISDDVENADIAVLHDENIKSLKKSFGKYSVKLNSKIDKIIYKELELNNFILSGSFNKEELALDKLNLNLLHGIMSGNFKIGLNTDEPTYVGNIDFKGVDVKNAVTIFLPDVKGVTAGNLSGDLDFSTSGYSMRPIIKSLVAKGDFSIDDFIYSSHELSTVMSKELADKLSGMTPEKNKKILGNDLGWETLQGVYNIKKEKVNIEKLFAKQGEYEATGKGEIGFDKNLNMYADLIVPYNEFSYSAVKLEGQERSLLCIHLTGSIVKPEFDTAYTVGYLAGKTLSHGAKKIKNLILLPFTPFM